MIATESREVEAGAAQADMMGVWAVDAWELEATLPYPVGVNRAWRHARGRTYKSREAQRWQTEASKTLQAAGLRPLPPGDWRIRLDYELFACRSGLDLDAPLKLLLDTVCMGGLGIDDRNVVEIHGRRRRVPHRAGQRLDVRIVVTHETS
jgi:Holliday junction resolvase RusA-like endonuclease